MKAHISGTGQLVITTENETEKYAMDMWVLNKRQPSGYTPERGTSYGFAEGSIKVEHLDTVSTPSRQEPLGYELEKIIEEKKWDLYVTSPKKD